VEHVYRLPRDKSEYTISVNGVTACVASTSRQSCTGATASRLDDEKAARLTALLDGDAERSRLKQEYDDAYAAERAASDVRFASLGDAEEGG